MPYDLRGAAREDDIDQSVDYGALSRVLSHTVDSASFSSLEALLEALFMAIFLNFGVVQEVEVALTKLRALPYARSVSIASRRKRHGKQLELDRFNLSGLTCNLIVGLNSCEREDKQEVQFDVTFTREAREGQAFGFRALGKSLREAAETTSFISLESLASLVAEVTLRYIGQPDSTVTVRASKPKALVFADAAQVELVRTSRDYQGSHNGVLDRSTVSAGPLGLGSLLEKSSQSRAYSTKDMKNAVIAFGSNVGDTFANIEAALCLLEDPAFTSPHSNEQLVIVNTSFLYETAPMYVLDQPKFINGALLVRTNFEPVALLAALKKAETAVGRVPSVRNGPRAVDLDLIFYENDIIDTRTESERVSADNLEGHLVVPHPLMAEREFVLRPLNDVIPEYPHPILKKTIRELLVSTLESSPVDSPAITRVIPFPDTSASIAPVLACPLVRPTVAHWSFPLHTQASRGPKGNTRIMAILNATPDSFSDGAAHNSTPAALSYAAASLSDGADILDVGGYSTRPDATFVTPDEEIARVVPIIKAIRLPRATEVRTALISVDTFCPSVAEAALEAGANCISDVYAFTGPDYPLTEESAKSFLDMRAIARKYNVPVVVMHSRGPAGKNQDYSMYHSVLDGVARELGEKVEAMIQGPGGIRRWQVIIDPGVGFSKTLSGNLEVIRDAASLTADFLSDETPNPLQGYPQLIGASRKSFLGKILGESSTENAYKGRDTVPRERGWATAATVACAVQQGVEIVRLHDICELGDVVRVADKLWK